MKKFVILFIAWAFSLAANACSVSFTYTYSPPNTFNFTSTATGFTGSVSYYWDFGDGDVSPLFNPSHYYYTSGSYHVMLTVMSSSGCSDTMGTWITVSSGGISLSGNIIRDSTIGPLTTDTLEVWLITYDSTTHLITAIDSTNTPMSFPGTSSTLYSFLSVPPGNYLIKTASMIYTSGGVGWVPTYHDSSVLWSAASYVSVSSSSVTGADIYQRYASYTSGPGFIAGDVLSGAGKGTSVGDPVPGLPMYLMNSGGHMIAMAYTDASGNYNFSNIPIGTYSIYPDLAGYAITPWISINITSSATNINKINFTKNSRSIKPGTAGIETTNVSQKHIAPNPANDIVRFTNLEINEPITVTIENAKGQKVYRTVLKTDNNGKANVYVSDLPNGLYFIYAIGYNTDLKEKLIIAH